MPTQYAELFFIETFADLSAGIKKHMELYPAHGRSCACLDQAARAVRNAFDVPSIHTPPEGKDSGEWIHEIVELSTRIYHVLRMATASY